MSRATDPPPGAIPPHGGYRDLRSYQFGETYRTYLETGPEVAANALLCLVYQACYLLDRQLRALERAFLQDGGFTERLYHARQRARGGSP